MRGSHLASLDSAHGTVIQTGVCPQRKALRRELLFGSIFTPLLLTSAAKADLPCRGLRSYDLRQCLREKRAQSGAVDQEESVREEYLKMRQFEQPGDLVTLPNGLQYREMEPGSPRLKVEKGSICSASYIVYRLSSGAYFKYSSGGTPVYMFSVGYGYEGKDDLDNIYQFKYGEKGVLPLAVAGAIEGMGVGGRRRILVPPQLGWVDNSVKPRPDTFGGSRRLASHRDEPLLFEIEIKRIQQRQDVSNTNVEDTLSVPSDSAYSLPAPPSSFQK